MFTGLKVQDRIGRKNECEGQISVALGCVKKWMVVIKSQKPQKNIVSIKLSHTHIMMRVEPSLPFSLHHLHTLDLNNIVTAVDPYSHFSSFLIFFNNYHLFFNNLSSFG